MKKNEELGSLNVGSRIYKTRISFKFANRKPYKPANLKIILSFIPGTVTDIYVKPGQHVEKGDVLMILDAMKMKNKLKAPTDGIIKIISVKTGDRVSKGTALLELE